MSFTPAQLQATTLQAVTQVMTMLLLLFLLLLPTVCWRS